MIGKTLMIGKAWTDMIADVQRRMRDFLLPAAAFVFMPTLLVSRFADTIRVGEAGAQAAQFLAALVGVVGQATIVALVLFPQIDVGSAIRRAAVAAPRIILGSLAILVVFVPLALLYTSIGGRPSLLLSTLLLVFTLVALMFALRLSMLAAAILAEGRTAMGALRRSFELTAGNVGRIMLLLGTVLLVFIITSALAGAVGIAATGGTPEDPSFVTEFLLAATSAVFSIFIAVVTAHIYRQLTA